MWNLNFIIKDYLRAKTFQDFINNRFKDQNKIILNKNVYSYITCNWSGYDVKFNFEDNIETIGQVKDSYDFSDIRPDDIVLDIGACIGGFGLNIANRVKHVYCVEPIMFNELKENIKLNNFNNVTVMELGLGDGHIIEAEWAGNKKLIQSKSLEEIIKICGGHVDFLKIDCEGWEEVIKAKELNDIRRIEIEVHDNHEITEKKLIDAGFKYKKDVYNIGKDLKQMAILHGKK